MIKYGIRTETGRAGKRDMMRNIRIYAIITVFCVLISSCSQWRVSELSSRKIMTLPVGNDPGKVSLVFTQDDFPEISFTINSGRNKYFVADNKAKRLQVFDKDGTLLNAISGKKVEGAGSGLFNFGMIGDVAADSEGRLYVQNRIDVSSAPRQGVPLQDKSDSGVSPSFVLVFDSASKLQYSMGQKGTADTPFYKVETLSVDADDRLWVICKNYETWSIYRFKNRVRDYFVSFGKETFGSEGEQGNVYTGVIENVVPFYSGKTFLVSVAYYHNIRFKYRKIYEYGVNENKTSRLLVTLPDPRNELFEILDDKYLLLWDTEEKNIKFAIWDLDGNVVNHLRIKFDKEKSYYNRIIGDENGKIMSYSVKKNGIDVLEWK
jgi:hypothetical protein